MSNNTGTNITRSRTNASVGAHLRHVNAFEEQGMYDKAIESLKKVIDLAPDNARHCIRLANLYRAQRQFEPAIEAMRKAIDLDPRNESAQESLLQIFLETGRYDDAIDGGKKLLRGYPRNLYARDILGVAYLQKGQIDEAMDVTNEMIYLDPMDAANHFKKAILFLRKGDLSKSLEEFIRVVEMDPEGELADEAKKEINALDDFQLRQIVVLASEDPVFRAKIVRDPESAVQTKGFNLSSLGITTLRQVQGELYEGAISAPQQRYYQ